MVLSKSKFSEFEPLPDGADLDNVFLAGYTSDEDGATYNVKVQASKITDTKAPNVIYELSSKDCCDNKYKWIEIDRGEYFSNINVCEFNTIDYGNYIEVQTLTDYIPHLCPDKTLYIKPCDNNTPGTEFTILINNLDPIDFKKICISDKCGNVKEVCSIEDSVNRPWGCLFKVIVTDKNMYSITATII